MQDYYSFTYRTHNYKRDCMLDLLVKFALLT
jgi:hypothetical protein